MNYYSKRKRSFINRKRHFKQNNWKLKSNESRSGKQSLSFVKSKQKLHEEFREAFVIIGAKIDSTFARSRTT